MQDCLSVRVQLTDSVCKDFPPSHQNDPNACRVQR